MIHGCFNALKSLTVFAQFTLEAFLVQLQSKAKGHTESYTQEKSPECDCSSGHGLTAFLKMNTKMSSHIHTFFLINFHICPGTPHDPR